MKERSERMSSASEAEASLTDLLCEDCGKNFTRESAYIQQKRTDPLFRWTCTKCDECKEKRVFLAFKRLPEIMQALNT